MIDKKIGLLTACALVIANMVGTGVFSSLGFQVGPLPSGGAILILWLCGGMIALCGGLSYIELARLMPGSGGEYHYIRSAYPKVVGYFSGLVSVIAGFAAPVALVAITLTHYLAQFAPQLHQQWTAFMIITFITLFHCFSLKLGSRFQLVTTAFKVLILLVFIGFGLHKSGVANPIIWDQHALGLLSTKGFAISLVYVSFAYSGWNACIYIFGEIKNPQKNIRRSIIIGTLLVTALYVLLNLVFLKSVPIAQLKGVIEIGAVSANVIFGSGLGKWMAILISMLLISSISAMVWVGPRVIESMMKRQNLNDNGQQSVHVPMKAMGIQYSVTVLLLATETFEQILVSAGVLLCICSSLSIAILFFRRKAVPLPRLVAPAIFLVANLYTLVVLMA